MTRPTTRARLALEPLEDRLLLAAVPLTAAIRGSLFNDRNGDGLRQAGDPAIVGRTVYLDRNGDGRLQLGEPRTTSARDGSFAFTNLAPGRYLVRQVVPPGWQATQFLAAPGLSAVPDGGGLIGLNRVRTDPRFAALDGRGFSVAVIDTGIAHSSAFPAGTVAYQHNFLTGAATAVDDSGHGTHVSSLIASRNPAYPGIAPGVQVIALKVLDASGGGDFATIEKALQWVLDHAEQYHIIDVNLSLGDGGSYGKPLSQYGIGDELAALARRNIAVVAAAGNEHSPSSKGFGLAYPAADPNVIAVGAVWDSNRGGPWEWDGGAVDRTTGPDRIVSFSQRTTGMGELFAPGTQLNGAVLGGRADQESGTSEAAAVVSGVIALAQQLARDRLGRLLGLPELRGLLTSTGAVIRDAGLDDNVAHTGAAFRRIDVAALAQAILDRGTVSPGRTADSRDVAVSAGGSVGGVVMGSFVPGQVTGTVFDDSNADGRRQPGEAGQTGMVVFADRNNNGRLDPGEPWTRSGAGGQFRLPGLVPGAIRLRLLLSPGQQQTTVALPLVITSGAVVTGQLVGVRFAAMLQSAHANNVASAQPANRVTTSATASAEPRGGMQPVDPLTRAPATMAGRRGKGWSGALDQGPSFAELG